MNKRSIYLPGLCVLLSACAGNPAAIDSGIAPPAAWQFAEREAAQATNQLWTHSASAQLNRLVDRPPAISTSPPRARCARAQAVR